MILGNLNCCYVVLAVCNYQAAVHQSKVIKLFPVRIQDTYSYVRTSYKLNNRKDTNNSTMDTVAPIKNRYPRRSLLLPKQPKKKRHAAIISIICVAIIICVYRFRRSSNAQSKVQRIGLQENMHRR